MGEFRERLQRWAENRARLLPWRETRDPWAVLVSEAMLQQTQVARVVPKYRAFLQQFPTVAACAAAPLAAVIDAWAGLGYNRRAVQLHRLATTVVAEHGGELPADLQTLLALPGIGPYTARAVLAFAFEADVGVVDTNVGRILARAHGRALGPRSAQALADAYVPHGAGWAWNQAMLDLGALVCVARIPRCRECPVASQCAYRGQGLDPALGSAGVSGPQSRFEGSDRQGRGRLVAALRRGPVRAEALAAAAGWPDDLPRAERVMVALVAEGLAAAAGDTYTLPAG